ncbi:hypothetical protein [Aureivirga marina]|uniref:hypothetical protein n=1 Tax=Aureivirga marina TaxID=1182451 RepID=UPI0018C928B5|nr:hypothetical protein [Aureivirga marina]
MHLINKLKPILLGLFATVFLLTSCSEEEDSVNNTNERNSFSMSQKLAEDTDFQNFVFTIGNIYYAQSETVELEYNGDAEAYQASMQKYGYTNSETKWTEKDVESFENMLGLENSTFARFNEYKIRVFEKFPELTTLTEEELNREFVNAIEIITFRGASANARMSDDDCKIACEYDFLACIATSTGVSIAALAGCIAISPCLPCTVACVGVIVVGNAFVIGGCYFKAKSCERKC